MRTRRCLVCGGLICWALLGLFPFLSLADVEIMVSVNAPAEVTSDSDIIIKIDVTEVTDLDVCQFDVGFDPRVLTVVDVTAGNIGGTAIPIDMWGEVAPGRIRVLGNVPGVPGVDGAGHLAEVHFRVVGSSGDASDIEFSNGLLGDKYAEAIAPVTWRGGSVRVADSTSPSTEVASFLGLAKTPAASAAAGEGGSEDGDLPALTYALVSLMIVVAAGVVWMYGRHRRQGDEG